MSVAALSISGKSFLGGSVGGNVSVATSTGSSSPSSLWMQLRQNLPNTTHRRVCRCGALIVNNEVTQSLEYTNNNHLFYLADEISLSLKSNTNRDEPIEIINKNNDTINDNKNVSTRLYGDRLKKESNFRKSIIQHEIKLSKECTFAPQTNHSKNRNKINKTRTVHKINPKARTARQAFLEGELCEKCLKESPLKLIPKDHAHPNGYRRYSRPGTAFGASSSSLRSNDSGITGKEISFVVEKENNISSPPSLSLLARKRPTGIPLPKSMCTRTHSQLSTGTEETDPSTDCVSPTINTDLADDVSIAPSIQVGDTSFHLVLSEIDEVELVSESSCASKKIYNNNNYNNNSTNYTGSSSLSTTTLNTISPSTTNNDTIVEGVEESKEENNGNDSNLINDDSKYDNDDNKNIIDIAEEKEMDVVSSELTTTQQQQLLLEEEGSEEIVYVPDDISELTSVSQPKLMSIDENSMKPNTIFSFYKGNSTIAAITGNNTDNVQKEPSPSSVAVTMPLARSHNSNSGKSILLHVIQEEGKSNTSSSSMEEININCSDSEDGNITISQEELARTVDRIGSMLKQRERENLLSKKKKKKKKKNITISQEELARTVDRIGSMLKQRERENLLSNEEKKEEEEETKISNSEDGNIIISQEELARTVERIGSMRKQRERENLLSTEEKEEEEETKISKKEENEEKVNEEDNYEEKNNSILIIPKFKPNIPKSQIINVYNNETPERLNLSFVALLNEEITIVSSRSSKDESRSSKGSDDATRDAPLEEDNSSW
eukprot:CAMPEP_0194194068 /NCGR_PEP_ID=MMETSP0154-20130528/75377_1 /TAXON_ID=1049557 /ORGANISM="Thalassiothrix antarctica, Strain L6-D1" /LENGTH=778 /DNA_ID=CAMNT_0038918457 /DNA_START=341 /DNA_END=2675 /DNA_ORIENTATION=+